MECGELRGPQEATVRWNKELARRDPMWSRQMEHSKGPKMSMTATIINKGVTAPSDTAR